MVILIASLTALTASIAIGFAVFSSPTETTQDQNNWMSQMWGSWSGRGNMMGQTGALQAATNPLLPYFGVLFAVLFSFAVIGTFGVVYYLLYPQIRIGTTQPTQKVAFQPETKGAPPLESVARTLTQEERKIVDVLNAHNGKYLQKYIRNETGLSRLQTHRIIARLADRGIVSLEKTGNTNQVFLANWLTQEPAKS